MATPRTNPDDGLAPDDFPALNKTFYRGRPDDYFARKLQWLVIAHGNPDGIDALMREGVQAGPVALKLDGDRSSDSPEGKEERERQAAFVIAEAWTTLHHVSETILRLYFAHEINSPCPALEVARQTNFKKFKKKTKQRFATEPSKPGDLKVYGTVFYGTSTGATLRPAPTPEHFEVVCRNIEDSLRMFARIFLESNAYNSAKHGFAVQPGHSQFNLEVGGESLGETQGPHIEFLEKTVNAKGDWSWAEATKWIDLGLVLQQIIVGQRMIDALWRTARHKYLAEPAKQYPRLDQPLFRELKADESITWSYMSRPLRYYDAE